MARNALQYGGSDSDNPLSAAPWTIPDPSDPTVPMSQGVAVAQTASAVDQWMEAQRQKSAQMGLWNDQTGLPTMAGVNAAVSDYGNALLMGTTAPGAKGPGFTAYHGSPHSFDAFDLSKIGTGEGAQAYGHGMYLADAEGVARGYRDALSNANRTPGSPSGRSGFAVNGEYPPTGMSGHTAMDTAMDMDGLLSYMHMHNTQPTAPFSDIDMRPSYQRSMDYLKGQIEGRIDRFRTRLGDTEPNGSADRDMADLANYYDQNVRNAQPSDVTPRPPGHMYEVQVNADPAHFLDWDKPLSEQHPVVQQNLADIIRYQQVPLKNNAGAETTGGQLYDYLQRRFNNDPHIAAQELHGEGIPGIRYLDAGSRGAGEGTMNSVVFNPANMEIIRKYGLAGLMAGGGAAALSGQQGQQQQ